MIRRYLLAATLGLLSWLAPGIAHAAINCVVNTAPVDLAFGTLTLPLNSNPTSTTVAVSCMRTQNGDSNKVLMCVGTESNPSPRLMNRTTAPPGTLSYDVYSDSAYSQIVNYTYNASTSINLPNRNVWYPGTVILYGRLTASQLTTTPGAYLHQVTNAVYGYSGAANANCATNVSLGGTYTLRASATLQGSCTIAAQTLNFGTHNILNVVRDAQANLTVTCTNGTPYTVKLDGGRAADVNARRMYLNGVGPQTIAYNLYTDSGRATIWGTGGGSGSTVLGNGTGSGQGSPQTLVVYGRVPVTPAFTAGAYSDVVTATVEF
ncbi:spore coat protein U domain-containing protein [Lysobacter koreensis]|uniref:Spore coat protein U domain-containing protein n=1 Tax=Lysobacter koreensis TaxID=266122 RepID=A0ABW2YSX6_9GAMM